MLFYSIWLKEQEVIDLMRIEMKPTSFNGAKGFKDAKNKTWETSILKKVALNVADKDK
jgi:hypothetical protein